MHDIMKFMLFLFVVTFVNIATGTTPPESTCGPNEHFETQSVRCQITCATMALEPYMGACYPSDSCFCDGNKVRDANGNCIDRSDCPKDCGKNAHYDKCPPCPPGKICTAACIPACLCNPGYKYNSNGECVKDQPLCGKNEHYDSCANNPCPKQLPKGIQCKIPCKGACVCNKGYKRDNDGNCVKDIPPPKCGKNEEYNKCGSACPDTCNNYKNTCRVCTKECVPGCFCKKGLVRNADGDCVEPNKCPKLVCNKPHEHYNPCPTNCPHGDGCDLLWSKFNCTGVPKCCAPACRCDPGYYRSKDGICITAKQCETKGQCADNSYYDSCINPCPPHKICPIPCIGDCVCDEGYEKDENKLCVKEQPTDPDECGPYGYYDDCSYCEDEYCDPGCVCYDGYEYDGYRGECVLKCGKNSHIDYCPPIHCEPGMACAQVCRPACVCDEGYKFNDNGICTKIDGKYQCPINEEYKKCGTACPKTCKNKDVEINCIAVCKSGCFCIGDRVRNDNGVCVLPSECPQPPCPKNETRAGCVIECPTNYCRNSNGPVPQCLQPYPCPSGCVCKPGYLRNNQNDRRCILKEDCPPPVICSKDEHYEECGTACPATCDNPSPTGCTDQCVRGCFCNSDLVRNKNGACVPKDQCPDTRCPKNEVYKSCGTPCPKTCQNKDKKQSCSGECKKGCFCVGNYVRNDKGVCVDPSECPLKCGKNEEPTDCNFSCPSDFCTKPGEPVALCKPAPCPPYRQGCRCKKGYLRNNRKENICVLEKDCPYYENGTTTQK